MSRSCSPPRVAACGAYVPMISGRGLGHSGGTLDKLDSVPGYTTQPSNELFRRVVKEIGCAIIGQTADLAPADKRVYAIRDVTATVESMPLITASILSKKLAAGLQALVLDVKTGNGAFMQTLEDAKGLAESLVGVANGAGLKTAALITDMDQPLASAAGNAVEVRNAVDFLTGAHVDKRLHTVTVALGAELLQLAGIERDAKAAYAEDRGMRFPPAAPPRFSARWSPPSAVRRTLSSARKDTSSRPRSSGMSRRPLPASSPASTPARSALLSSNSAAVVASRPTRSIIRSGSRASRLSAIKRRHRPSHRRRPRAQ